MNREIRDMMEQAVKGKMFLVMNQEVMPSIGDDIQFEKRRKEWSDLENGKMMRAVRVWAGDGWRSKICSRRTR